MVLQVMPNPPNPQYCRSYFWHFYLKTAEACYIMNLWSSILQQNKASQKEIQGMLPQHISDVVVARMSSVLRHVKHNASWRSATVMQYILSSNWLLWAQLFWHSSTKIWHERKNNGETVQYAPSLEIWHEFAISNNSSVDKDIIGPQPSALRDLYWQDVTEVKSDRSSPK